MKIGFNELMKNVRLLASHYYEIDELDVQIAFSSLEDDMGWQAYIQRACYDSCGGLLSAKVFLDGNLGEGYTTLEALECLEKVLVAAMNRKIVIASVCVNTDKRCRVTW